MAQRVFDVKPDICVFKRYNLVVSTNGSDEEAIRKYMHQKAEKDNMNYN